MTTRKTAVQLHTKDYSTSNFALHHKQHNTTKTDNNSNVNKSPKNPRSLFFLSLFPIFIHALWIVNCELGIVNNRNRYLIFNTHKTNSVCLNSAFCILHEHCKLQTGNYCEACKIMTNLIRHGFSLQKSSSFIHYLFMYTILHLVTEPESHFPHFDTWHSTLDSWWTFPLSV